METFSTQQTIPAGETVQLLPDNVSRKAFAIRPVDGDIYLGTTEAEATAGDGFPVYVKEVFDDLTDDSIWAFAAADTDVRIWEVT